jgi:hypothetical protein
MLSNSFEGGRHSVIIKKLNTMNEFVLIFRTDYLPEAKFSPDEMQSMMQHWQNWMGSIAAQNKLASTGNRLGSSGATLKPGNVITNGPFAEIKEIITGYIVVRAESIDEAAEMAKGCPLVVGGGGQVEVRNIIPMGN